MFISATRHPLRRGLALEVGLRRAKFRLTPSSNLTRNTEIVRRVRRAFTDRLPDCLKVERHYPCVTAQGLIIASSGSAIWKLARLEGFGNRYNVQDNAKRDIDEGGKVFQIENWIAPLPK